MLANQVDKLKKLSAVPETVIAQAVALDKNLVNAFIEISYNLLYSELGLSAEEKLELKKFKTKIKLVANKKNSKNILVQNPNLAKLLLKTISPLLNG